MKIKNVLSFLLAAVMTATSIPVITASAAPASTPVSVTGTGATTVTAEDSGNHYLYVMNKDLKSAEGVQVEFTPVAGVKEYKVSANVRGAGNINSTGVAVPVRTTHNPSIVPEPNAVVSSTNFGMTNATWNAASETVTVTNTALPAKFVINVNQSDADALEVDNLRIYYVKGGQQKDVAFFDFEDGLLAKNGATLTPSADTSGGYNADGHGAIEIREENDYYRVNSGEATVDFGDDFEAGIYTLSGDFRMPYFQNTGSGRNYDWDTHRAIVTVYRNSVKVGELNGDFYRAPYGINPYWHTYSVEGIIINPAEDIITFTVEGGVTDTNEYATAYKNAVDIMGLTLTKTADYNPDEDAAEQVDALITAIGEVNDDSEAKITAARAAYTALNDTAKSYVTKLAVLEAAEKAFELLPVTKPAKAVDALIAAIGEVTEDSEDKITAARAAYTALGDASKTYVTKLKVLEAAEAKLEFITTPAPISGAEKMGAELVGNKYLYVKNKDYRCPEGIMVAFAPIDGVAEYKVTAKLRGANLIGNNLRHVRTLALNGTCTTESWFGTATASWSEAGAAEAIKPAGDATSFGNVVQFSININADYGNALELDDLRIYYIDAEGGEVEVAFFDFEDGALTKNGVTLTACENVNGYAQFDGATAIEIREEKHYYRVADLSGDNAGAMSFDPALDPAVYTISGEFRMPYFQNTGTGRLYDEGIHTATVTVTNGDTEIGTFDISPYWNKVELPFSALTPIDSLKFTVASSGITDTNDTAAAYKNGIDVIDLKVEKTRSFDGAVVSEGFVTSLDTYTTDDLNTVTSADGYLHIYNRDVSATQNKSGIGFVLEETLNQGETYTINFRARQPLASAHLTPLNLQITKNGVAYATAAPSNPSLYYTELFATIPMTNDGVHYFDRRGVAVAEGWFDYTMIFTPRDGDIENPEFILYSEFCGGTQEAFRYESGGMWHNALNPIDIDWIEILDGNGDSVLRDDFNGTLNSRYVSTDLLTLNAGSAKLIIAEDEHTSIMAKEGAPTLKLSGFDVPELVPGKYALTFDARLGYYEASLGTEGSVASLDMAITNSDTTTAAKKTEINTEWSTITYSFFVTDTCKPSEIAITLSGIDGGVENLKRFDFKNFAVTSQIFEIETEDENSLMNGVDIYSVGDTVKTEVLDDDGVTPDGYLHVYDRPLDKHHGVAIKLDTPLEGGERYYITFKARMSYTGTGNTVLTVSGNGVATGYNERNPSKDVAATWAMPVIGKTPSPYFSTTHGAYLKDFWQTYTYEYAPVDDVAEPIFAFASTYYWNNDGSETTVRWGAGQYNLHQDAIDIDDIVIYKVGDEANPLWQDDFNSGVGKNYKPAEAGPGNNQGTSFGTGGCNFDAGKAKLSHATDVYESVVNDSAAPKLNLSGFNTFPTGRYALTVWVRRNAVYNSGVSFDEQETDTIAIIGTQSTAPENFGGEAGTEKDIDRYEIGFEWTKISYIFNIDETTTSLDEIVIFLDNGDQPGRFDYRDFEFEQLEDDSLPPPAPGVVMMYLYKKQIRKITNPEEFIREEKEEVLEFVDKDYFEGILAADGLAKWSAPLQTLTAGKLTDGTEYLRVSDIKTNYTPLTYAPDEKLPAGGYHFKLDIRTANIGEESRVRLEVCGQSRSVRINNDWTTLEFLIVVSEPTKLSISFRGGPLAFYNKDYDIANLSLRALDNRKIEVNAFDHTEFNDEATAMRGLSAGGKGMSYTYMTETVGEGENAATNGFLRISDRVRNYDQFFLNTGVKMVAGETYTVTYDIRLVEEGFSMMRGSVGVSGNVKTKLYVEGEGHPDPTNSAHNEYSVSHKWKTVTSTFVAADSGTMILSIGGGQSTTNIEDYDIDNLIILAKVTPVIRIGANKYENGDFEDKDTALASWVGQTHETLGWVGQTFEHNTDEDGNSYVTISGREANYQTFTLNTGVKVNAGATYQITYRVRTSEVDEDGSSLRAVAGASTKKTYKLKVDGEGMDDPASGSYHEFSVPDKWKTVTCLYVAEADGELGIEFNGGTSPVYIENLDFDGFEVYEVYAG